MVCFKVMEFSRAYVFITAAFFAWSNTWSAFGIQRVRFVSIFP